MICHHDEPINRLGVARWLASFSELSGIIEIHEPGRRLWRRVRREFRRVGPRLVLSARDRAFEAAALERLSATYPPLDPRTPVLVTHDPNSAEVVAFMRGLAPDVVLARCKTLLKKDVYSLPARGTFVLHTGICPEYRNAHGCYWALAHDDLSKVGATLLQIDDGVDTGPIYGYFSYRYDEVAESPGMIYDRVVLENLEAIRQRLVDIVAGRVRPLDTSGRRSATWGQPWLTKYLRWKLRARKRRRENACVRVS